jgi:hypothetical protein
MTQRIFGAFRTIAISPYNRLIGAGETHKDFQIDRYSASYEEIPQ